MERFVSPRGAKYAYTYMNCSCLWSVCMCMLTHLRRRSFSVQLSLLYYVHPACHFLFLCATQYVFFVQTPWMPWLVNAMWTLYKRHTARLGRDGCNMCSVMCAVIDMLKSVFQATASKPRLTALIGFSRVCGCILQCNLRHSVDSSLCLKMPKYLLFSLFTCKISVG